MRQSSTEHFNNLSIMKNLKEHHRSIEKSKENQLGSYQLNISTTELQQQKTQKNTKDPQGNPKKTNHQLIILKN